MYVKYNVIYNVLGQVLFKSSMFLFSSYFLEHSGITARNKPIDGPKYLKKTPKNRPIDGSKHLKKPKAHIKKAVIKSPVIFFE